MYTRAVLLRVWTCDCIDCLENSKCHYLYLINETKQKIEVLGKIWHLRWAMDRSIKALELQSIQAKQVMNCWDWHRLNYLIINRIISMRLSITLEKDDQDNIYPVSIDGSLYIFIRRCYRKLYE